MTTAKREAGFTLIEVLIAIGIVSIGILALLQMAGASTIMLRDGRLRTLAGAMSASRLDNLRLAAASTDPACTALSGGSATSVHGTETWTIAGSGRSRTVIETVQVSNGRRQLSMTVRGTLFCP